jgi:hypothetical protein
MMYRRSAAAALLGVHPGGRRAITVSCGSFKRLACDFFFMFIIPASGHFGFLFEVCGFCLFKDVDKMFALSGIC